VAYVCTYLNFPRETAEAFEFYRSVFGTEYSTPTVRMGDNPMPEGAPPLAEGDEDLIMHVALPILGGHTLMGTDAPESMGMHVEVGNNVRIQLGPDSREDTDRLFAALAEGGNVEVPLQDMFWGAYYGALVDKFGIRWSFNYDAAL
jgi:PhnB protein